MAQVFIETLLIGSGTYLIRGGSLSLGSRVAWPDWLKRWLSYVTPAVLGALLGPLLLLQSGHLTPLWHNSSLLSAVPTGVVAWYTRHLLWTVAAGVVCFALVTHLMQS